MNDIRKIARRLNELLPSWIEEYRIIGQSRSHLILGASFDWCYYHDIEIEFAGVAYFDCAEVFRAVEIRVVDGAQKAIIAKECGFSTESLLLEIECEEGVCRIAAEEVKLNEAMVYHYLRENLKLGERIADWVRRSDA